MNGVDVLLLQSAVNIPAHRLKLSCRNVEGAVICVLHALVSLPFSEMKGAKIQFDRRLGAHRMSSRPPTRTATSGKNYWAILRGTGIPESIRAIGVSYSYWSRLDGRHASRPCSQWIDGAEQEPQRSKEKAAGMAGRGVARGNAACLRNRGITGIGA